MLNRGVVDIQDGLGTGVQHFSNPRPQVAPDAPQWGKAWRRDGPRSSDDRESHPLHLISAFGHLHLPSQSRRILSWWLGRNISTDKKVERSRGRKNAMNFQAPSRKVFPSPGQFQKASIVWNPNRQTTTLHFFHLSSGFVHAHPSAPTRKVQSQCPIGSLPKSPHFQSPQTHQTPG